jgi:hypothetical protein
MTAARFLADSATSDSCNVSLIDGYPHYASLSKPSRQVAVGRRHPFERFHKGGVVPLTWLLCTFRYGSSSVLNFYCSNMWGEINLHQLMNRQCYIAHVGCQNRLKPCTTALCISGTLTGKVLTDFATPGQIWIHLLMNSPQSNANRRCCISWWVETTSQRQSYLRCMEGNGTAGPLERSMATEWPRQTEISIEGISNVQQGMCRRID